MPLLAKLTVIGWLPVWKAAAVAGVTSPSDSKVPSPVLVEAAATVL